MKIALFAFLFSALCFGQELEHVFAFYIGADEGDPSEVQLKEPNARMFQGLEQMEALKTNSKVAVVLQMDESGDDPNYRYEISYQGKSNKPDSFLSKPIPEEKIRAVGPEFANFKYQERNSGSAQTWKEFVWWVIRAYPAKRYTFFLNGHSWGKLGVIEDYFKKGKKLKAATMIRNYEVRRSLEELKIEAKKKLNRTPNFSTLVVDACIWAQLDTTLEIADQFKYFMGTSLENPYHGVSYGNILNEFITVVNKSNYNSEEDRDKDIEEHFLRKTVASYITEHAPGKELSLAESQVDVVQSIAIRTAVLKKVAQRFSVFAESIPTKTRHAFHKDQLENLLNFRDADKNIDMQLMLKTFHKIFAKEFKASGQLEDSWKVAAANAQAVIDTMGYNAANPTMEPTLLEHPKALGAWVKIDIDPYAKLPVAACNALQAYVSLNKAMDREVPQIFDKDKKEVQIKEYFCDLLNDEFKKGDSKSEGAELGEFNKLYNFTIKWPNEIPARLIEEGKQHQLAVWIQKEDKKHFKTSYNFHLPATEHVQIHYVLEKPEKYAEKGFKSDKLQAASPEDVSLQSYYVAKPEELYNAKDRNEPSLYVAAAHSNGTNKEGLSLFMDREFPKKDELSEGYLPAERIERQPLSETSEWHLSTETYELFRDELESSGKVSDAMVRVYGKFFKNLKTGQTKKQFLRTGFELFRLSKTPATWINFLEGR